MGGAEVRRLRQLEEENRKLKQLVADLSLDREMLQDVLKKMDFMADQLANGQRFRVFTLVDDFSCESVYIGVPSIKAPQLDPRALIFRNEIGLNYPSRPTQKL